MVVDVNYISRKLGELLERREQRKLNKEKDKDKKRELKRIKESRWRSVFSWKPRLLDGTYFIWLGFLERKQASFCDGYDYRYRANSIKLTTKNLAKHLLQLELDETLSELSKEVKHILKYVASGSVYDRERTKYNILDILQNTN